MGQFDNPKSIAVLFAGAFLCSLGVIAFLNAEVQSRSNYGSRIRNESLLEILGKKLSQTLTLLKEKNSHRRSLLYRLFMSENVTRASLRKLQYFSEDTIAVKEKMKPNMNETHHRLRHEKKARREMELRRKNELTFFSEEKRKKTAGGSNSFFDFTKNGTVAVYAKNTSGEVISKHKLAEHQHCYTTNDVLEIIAITCLVNFIFWFMIIFCVNIFTKNQMWKSQSFRSGTRPLIWCGAVFSLTLFPSWNIPTTFWGEFAAIRGKNGSESLASISSISEDELNGPGSKAPQVLNRRNTVDCYVDSFNVHAKGEERSRLETEILVPEKFNAAGKRKKKTFRIINWRRDKLIRFSNSSFDRNSVADSEENRSRKYLSQNKKQKNVNSFSMENLIF